MKINKILFWAVVILMLTTGAGIYSQTGEGKNMKIIDHLLPYNDNLEKRDVDTIDMIVLHCTELPTLAEARQYAEKILYKKTRTGNAGHYYIDRDGQVYRYVKDDRTAHHVKGYNGQAIGLEIVNRGRYPHWFVSTRQIPTEEYTPGQIESVIRLITYLKKKYPGISTLKRHSDLDREKIKAEDKPEILIRRKIDPGPLFPWEEVLRKFFEKV